MNNLDAVERSDGFKGGEEDREAPDLQRGILCRREGSGWFSSGWLLSSTSSLMLLSTDIASGWAEKGMDDPEERWVSKLG